MKRLEYKVVTSTKGFPDLEAEITRMLNAGWKPLGGLAFNQGYPYQAMARVVQEEASRPRTANEAMSVLESLT